VLVLTFPTNQSLDVVTQEYVVDRSKFIGDQVMPYVDFNSFTVKWDERDAERGMTKPHAMDADPAIDKRPGSKTKSYEGIPFKESDVLKESDLLTGRALGTLGGTLNVSTEVARIMQARMDKTMIRVEWARWQALRGQLSINENGVKVVENFPIQTYDASDWGDPANATPLKDEEEAALLFKGTGASADGAVEYMNRKTLNKLLGNRNDNDLWGFRSQNFLNLTFSLDEANKIFAARGLPSKALYDGGYIDADGDFQTFIPDDETITIGKRPAGQVVGNFARTISLHRIVNGAPAPGFFEIINVNGGPNTGATQINLAQLGTDPNPSIKMTGGVYGGPLLWYPRSVIRKDVGA
jgi:hypothetical protein